MIAKSNFLLLIEESICFFVPNFFLVKECYLLMNGSGNDFHLNRINSIENGIQ